MAKQVKKTAKKVAKTTTKKATTRNSTTGTRTTAGRGAVRKARTLTTPTEEQIRQRAFDIYQRRAGGPGDAHADWTQAERELTAELNGK